MSTAVSGLCTSPACDVVLAGLCVGVLVIAGLCVGVLNSNRGSDLCTNPACDVVLAGLCDVVIAGLCGSPCLCWLV